MQRDEVIDKLRELDIQYVRERVGSDPTALPNHFAEYLGYANLLYDHYAEFIKQYEIKESAVVREENAQRNEFNKTAENFRDKISVAEVEQRVAVRLGDLKGERKRLELAVKGATLHINGCQSLMKNWSDEAKGVR